MVRFRFKADQIAAMGGGVIALGLGGTLLWAGFGLIEQVDNLTKPIIVVLVTYISVPIFGLSLPLFSYVSDNSAVLARLSRIEAIDCATKGSRSLLVEVLETLSIVALVVIASGLIYWLTNDLSFDAHLTSVCLGLLALFLVVCWSNRRSSIGRLINDALTATGIIGLIALGLLFGLAAEDGPLGVAEVIAWLIPILFPYLAVKDQLEKLRAARQPRNEDWKKAFKLLWLASDRILEQVGRSSTATQSMAVVLTLLVFLLPAEFGNLVPPDAKQMFLTVWRELGEFPFKQQYVSYFALGAFVMFSCSEFVDLVPDVIPDRWILVGPLYNILLKSVLVLAFLLTVAPIFIVIFAIGYALLGNDLAVVVGFFTFPQWSQRCFAIFVAAFALSFDDPNSLPGPGGQLTLEFDQR